MMFKKMDHRSHEQLSSGDYWSVMKQQVSKSPLTALGVAAGAGLLLAGLLKPKPRHQNFFGQSAHAISARRMRSRANRTFKSLIGSLALSYLNRKLNSKLRWR